MKASFGPPDISMFTLYFIKSLLIWSSGSVLFHEGWPNQSSFEIWHVPLIQNKIFETIFRFTFTCFHILQPIDFGFTVCCASAHPSYHSSLSTLLYRTNFWHALAPSLSGSGLDGLFFSILFVGPLHLLLQISLGAHLASALEEQPWAKPGAERIKG